MPTIGEVTSGPDKVAMPRAGAILGEGCNTIDFVVEDDHALESGQVTVRLTCAGEAQARELHPLRNADGTFSLVLADGSYRTIEVGAVDSAGNEAQTVTYTDVLVDTARPRVDVLFEDELGGGRARGYFGQARTLSVTVTDEHFDPSSFEVRVARALDGDDERKVIRDSEMGAGHWLAGKGGTHTIKIPVGEEGDYAADCVTVTGVDRAGNPIEGSVPDGSFAPSVAPFVIDTTPPQVAVAYDGPEARHVDADGTGYYDTHVDGARTLVLTARDRAFDPSGLRVAISRTASDDDCAHVPIPEPELGGWQPVEGVANTYELRISDEIKADGRYEVSVTGTADRAGNDVVVDEVASDLAPFVIDTTAPQVAVSYDGPDARYTDDSGTRYFAGSRTMVLHVTDRTFDPTGLQIDVARTDSASDHGGENVVCVGPDAWRRVGDTYVLEVERAIVDDGRYEVEISGTADKLGHDVVVNEAVSDLAPYVVDTVAPVVKVTPQPACAIGPDGRRYYNAPTTVAVAVTDRNLDVASAQSAAEIANGTGTISKAGMDGWASTRGADGNVTYVTSVTYDELPGAQAGQASYTPRLTVADLVGWTSEHDDDGQGVPFYVDCTAPRVVAASVDSRPVHAEEGGSYQFYDQAASVVISLEEPYGLESVTLSDPDGTYDLSNQVAWGKRGDITIEVPLVDGAQRGTDTEFERNIVLEMRDIAGNVRDWGIGPDGSVADARGSSAANAPLVVSGVANGHPKRLIDDVTRPDILMTGVEAGRYYNASQSVHVLVNEFNFAYLRRFDAMRSIITVAKHDGDAGRRQSSWRVPAASFAGSGAAWTYDQVFDADGHYTLVAHFRDIANNESNTCEIGDFTIDMTAPVVTVAWDNDGVRSDVGGVRYYDSDRTATITVTEHNFDPALVDVSTDGVIGEWSTNGDAHTCMVSFGEGRGHTLSVSGKDLAGNMANSFSEPAFAIDRTAPAVEIGGKAVRYDRGGDDPDADAGDGALHDRTAYNGEVAPVITFADETCLDADGSCVDSFEGSRRGDAITSTFSPDVVVMGNRKVVAYTDLGRFGDGRVDAGNVTATHDINADDVYTIQATARDLAGNVAQATSTFSVNRFGSNYVDVALLDETGSALTGTMLSAAPYLTFTEVNVSGSKTEADTRSVVKEHANVTSAIEPNKDVTLPSAEDGYEELARPRGYSVTSSFDGARGAGGAGDSGAGDGRQADGWAAYTYVIGNGNFGAGSPSDKGGDGGQGSYRVSIIGSDAAGNLNESASFWAPMGTADAGRTNAEVRQAMAQFRLDQTGPTIDQVDVPHGLGVGGRYTVRFHVTDMVCDPDNPDRVSVVYDGVPYEAAATSAAGGRLDEAGDARDGGVDVGAARIKDEGNGTYSFEVEGRPFRPQSITLAAVDWNGRTAADGGADHTYRFYLSDLRLEVGLAVATAVAILAAALCVRRSRRRRETDVRAARRRVE